MVAEAEIRKPGNDSREYRAIVLSNELRVLLVSDPDTDKVCIKFHTQNHHRKRTIFVSSDQWVCCNALMSRTQAAAAMSVNVGSFSNPEGLEGLAHFLGTIF